jgi:putative phage-type endonuclease
MKQISKRVNKKVSALLLKPQYAQRTPEWFAQRKTRVTASEVANCLVYNEIACREYMNQFPHVTMKLNDKPINSYQSYMEYLIQKCNNVPFTDNVSTLHGKKYEDVACALYTRIKDKDVYDFGLINHPRLKWLAASPDGITNDGVMLEIKCPNKRKIKDNETPLMYWIQMQIQMEVCNLNECDYLECEIEQVSENDFFQGVHEYKGIIGKWSDTSTFIYPPKNVSSIGDFLLWQESLQFSLGPHVSFDYYIIRKHQIITINRSKIWFDGVKSIIKKAHDDITKHQNDPGLLQEYTRKYNESKNKKFMDKFNTITCTL